MNQHLNPTSMHKPMGTYSHSVAVPAGSTMVFVAGQVGVRPDGSTAATLAEQSEVAMTNVMTALAAHGLGAADIVKLNTYVVAGQDLSAVRAARARHLGDARPASTLVYIPALVDPALLVEIEAVAAR